MASKFPERPAASWLVSVVDAGAGVRTKALAFMSWLWRELERRDDQRI
jgi:hypothetical protein